MALAPSEHGDKLSKDEEVVSLLRRIEGFVESEKATGSGSCSVTDVCKWQQRQQSTMNKGKT